MNSFILLFLLIAGYIAIDWVIEFYSRISARAREEAEIRRKLRLKVSLTKRLAALEAEEKEKETL